MMDLAREAFKTSRGSACEYIKKLCPLQCLDSCSLEAVCRLCGLVADT